MVYDLPNSIHRPPRQSPAFRQRSHRRPFQNVLIDKRVYHGRGLRGGPECWPQLSQLSLSPIVPTRPNKETCPHERRTRSSSPKMRVRGAQRMHATVRTKHLLDYYFIRQKCQLAMALYVTLKVKYFPHLIYVLRFNIGIHDVIISWRSGGFTVRIMFQHTQLRCPSIKALVCCNTSSYTSAFDNPGAK